MQKTDRYYYLLANHLPNVSLRLIEKWRQHFGGLADIFSVTGKNLALAGLTDKQIDALKQLKPEYVAQDLEWAEKDGNHLITVADNDYPELLKHTASPPMVLYALGNKSLLDRLQLAMVGARHATPAGLDMAESFAESFADSGLCVTSGLALGIDAASHRGAMRARAKTIAVMGTGMNFIYPQGHGKLAREIVEQSGLLLTEFPQYIGPKAYNFPRRNRVIAGLSRGVLVVEAALKSGSLITAKYALEEGREVFAIPGSIHNPLARGCHTLIRQGAKLVETAQDVISELQGVCQLHLQNGTVVSDNKLNISGKESKVYSQIDYVSTPIDVIVWRSGLTVAEVSSILLSLELNGYVHAAAGGYVKK